MIGQPPRVGLNLFAIDAFRAAAGPLFEEELVDALEWDVDETWGFDGGEELRRLPQWVDQLLDLYSESNSLYGHGVWFSMLSARWEKRQERWLENLRSECRRRQYRHLSEHFGFLSAGHFSRGTVFPVPHTPAAVRIGRDRLGRISDASGGLHVGLENTAVALCTADAENQGAFLDELLAPLDGFLLFDLHNVWTQCRNLGLSAEALLPRYPLERVREIHVSGGSWYQPSTDPGKGPFRLDSHDGPVPDEAFALVPIALRHCPNVEVVIFEQRGANLSRPEDVASYQSEFRRLRSIVESVYA
jgi:uncharacterized protein (UPF0276 family)